MHWRQSISRHRCFWLLQDWHSCLVQVFERPRPAVVFMFLRGFIVIIPTFILLPTIIGNLGLWLAVPLSELLTLAVIVGYSWHKQTILSAN